MPRYEYPGYKPAGEGWLGARPGTKGGYHGGTDNPAAPGTPVYAEHGGRVFRSGPINGYGMSVIVQSQAPDGTPFYELYGHLGPGPLPDPGAEIAAGKPIPGATIGETKYVISQGGISTGPHLHREIISGKIPLNAKGGLGLYSSEIARKADPETFDVNHPVFPYEHGEPLPPPIPPVRPGGGITPQRPASSTHSSDMPDAESRSERRTRSPAELLPGMAIPGAVGPTSIGGPAGPTPVVPPAEPPLGRPSDSSPTMSPLNFAPEPRPNVGPFTLRGPSPSGAVPTVQGGHDQRSGEPLTAAAVMPPGQVFERAPASVDAAERASVQIRDGGRIGNWWDAPVGQQLPQSDGAWADIPMARISPAARSEHSVDDDSAGNKALDPESGQSPQSAAALLGRLDQLRIERDRLVPSLLRPASRESYVSASAGQALSSPPRVSFPLQALLANDHGRALDDWAASSRDLAKAPAQRAPGGLLGLLASITGIDSANQFVQTSPDDDVPVRQLVSRLVGS